MPNELPNENDTEAERDAEREDEDEPNAERDEPNETDTEDYADANAEAEQSETDYEESEEVDSQLGEFEDNDIWIEASHWMGPPTSRWKRVYTGNGTDEISLLKGKLWDALESNNDDEADLLERRLEDIRARIVLRALQDESRQPTEDVHFTEDTFDTLVSHMVYRNDANDGSLRSAMRHPYQYLCRRVDSNHRVNLPAKYIEAENPADGRVEAARIVHELAILWKDAGEFFLPKRQGRAEAFFMHEIAHLAQYIQGLTRDESPHTGVALVGYDGAQELNLRYLGAGGRVAVRILVGYPKLSSWEGPLYKHGRIADFAFGQLGEAAAGVFMHLHLVDSGAHHFLFLSQYSKAVLPVAIGVGTRDEWDKGHGTVNIFF